MRMRRLRHQADRNAAVAGEDGSSSRRQAESVNAPLRGDALAHLRHELRTPFNQLLGYTAILLEDAEQGGFNTVAPALTGIQAGGRALLERIQSALSDAGEGVSFEQLAALESKVRPEAEQLLE